MNMSTEIGSSFVRQIPAKAMKNKLKRFTLHRAHLVHILLNKELPQVKLEKKQTPHLYF